MKKKRKLHKGVERPAILVFEPSNLFFQIQGEGGREGVKIHKLNFRFGLNSG
jgi:hypothetical protein